MGLVTGDRPSNYFDPAAPVAAATSSSLRGRCWMTRSPSTSAMEEKATREELAALLAKMRSGNGPATVEEDAHTGTCALS